MPVSQIALYFLYLYVVVGGMTTIYAVVRDYIKDRDNGVSFYLLQVPFWPRYWRDRAKKRRW